MKITTFFTLCTISYLYGCGHAEYKQTAVVIDTFPNKIVCEPAEQLSFEVLDPTAVIASDSLIVLLVRHEEQVLKIFDKQTRCLKGKMLSKGKGPNEVHMLNRINQWDIENGRFQLLIQSYPYFLGWLDVLASLDSGRTVFATKYDFTQTVETQMLLASSNVVFDWKNSKLIMNKDPERSNTIKDNPNPFYVVYDYQTGQTSDTTYLKSLLPLPTLATHNTLAYSGYSSISPEANTWARAFTYLGTVDFFDLQNRTQTRVCLSPDVFDYEALLQHPKEHFKESAATRDYFFVLSAVDPDDGCRIYMFDWSGHPLCEMQFKIPLRFFSVNQQTEELFAIDREERIFRFDIHRAFCPADPEKQGTTAKE